MTEKIEGRINELTELLEQAKANLASNNATLTELKETIKHGEMRCVALSNRISELKDLLAEEIF